MRLPISLYGVQANYANALYKLSVKTKEIDTVEANLTNFAEFIESNPKLKEYIANPIFSKGDKAADITKIAKGLGYNQTTQNFLGVVSENGRLHEIKEIMKKFTELMKARKGIVEATVTTAKKLSNSQVKTVQNAIQKQYIESGKNAEITFTVDTSIIGGLQLQIGDRFLDLSVASDIGKLNHALHTT